MEIDTNKYIYKIPDGYEDAARLAANDAYLYGEGFMKVFPPGHAGPRIKHVPYNEIIKKGKEDGTRY